MSALFEDLIGQPLAIDLLSAALAQGRVALAYLFAGPDGGGSCCMRFEGDTDSLSGSVDAAGAQSS